MTFEADKPCSVCGDVKPPASFVDDKPLCLKCTKLNQAPVKKMSLPQSENFMIKFFKDAYATGNKKIIIDRVKITYECFLQCGLDVATITRQLFDFGLREEENAMGLIEGIMKVPDEKLSNLDKIIKKKSVETYAKMLLALYEETIKEKRKK